MNSVESYSVEAHRAIAEVAQDFHVHAVTNDGRELYVPSSYQINEPGFRPYRAGKASAAEQQAEFDLMVATAAERGVDLGIEGVDSVKKLLLQQGLGIDCSNFAFHSLDLIHQRMNLGDYTQTVFRKSADILALHEKKGSWLPKDDRGDPRDLTSEEQTTLDNEPFVSIRWVSEVFQKDPLFILGSSHITAPEASAEIEALDLLPGDLIAFRSTRSGAVGHVAMVSEVDVDSHDATHVDFWHAWHTRDFDSGLRLDSVTFRGDGVVMWAHQGLGDPYRYQSVELRRPNAMAGLVDSLA